MGTGSPNRVHSSQPTDTGAISTNTPISAPSPERFFSRSTSSAIREEVPVECFVCPLCNYTFVNFLLEVEDKSDAAATEGIIQ